MIQSRHTIAEPGKTFRKKNISKRVRASLLSSIKRMSLVAEEIRVRTRADIISFGQGIPHIDTAKHVKDAMRKALKQKGTARYTLGPGIPKLRRLIGKHLEKTKGIRGIQPMKEVVVTTGCQEALACALATTVDPGDEVILFSPGFASHWEQILQFSGKPIFVPLIEKEGWRLDSKRVEKRVSKKTKVILFSNPSNPTGMVLSEKDVREIARIAKKYDLIIITDETYDFLTYEDVRHISLTSFSDIRDRVILCGSFSKRYCLTGYRIGYAFTDQGIIEHIIKVHDALTICAPTISQKAVIAALKGPQDSVTQLVKAFSENRSLMCEKLDELNELFEYQRPMGAYYIFPKIKIPHKNSFDFALRILHEAHVVVIPGAAFGPSGERHVRLSFACSPGEITEGFTRLKGWFKRQTL